MFAKHTLYILTNSIYSSAATPARIPPMTAGIAVAAAPALLTLVVAAITVAELVAVATEVLRTTSVLVEREPSDRVLVLMTVWL